MAASDLNCDARGMMAVLHRVRRSAVRVGVALALGAAALGAFAQAHEVAQGDYVLRSSVVRSELLPAATTREHGITRAPDRAVVNIVLLRGAEPVPADVAVSTLDLNGRRRTIDVRPVVANDDVSYLGVFEFLPREVLDFRIEATPAGGGPQLTLGYRERMWFY